MALPVIIQGGMGIAISTWRLARAVAQLGQLGVVSGTAIGRVLVCRLAEGDRDGHVRRALANFPLPEPAQEIITRYYIAGGIAGDAPYPPTPAYTVRPSPLLERLTVLANYVEVWLAKEGHSGPVGLNLLTKVQLPTLASLYGAMLAGVDYVLMGAGIPTHIAGLLDRLATHQPVSQRLETAGAGPEDELRLHLDPEALLPGIARLAGPLKRPAFLPIVASVTLAQALLKRSEGRVDGFVVEGPTAGGHNAPPRGALTINERGEPIYGDRDLVDAAKMAQLGLPFWLGGGYGHPAQVQAALGAGAAGVQVGTAFALCDEAGLAADLKERLLRRVLTGEGEVLTSMAASPTGFPFKVARLEGTLAEGDAYRARRRVCDLGFLRTIVRQADGSCAYRCPAEPVDDYVAKGGAVEDTVGRLCLCNGLMASAGFPQRRRDGTLELPLVTAGDDLATVGAFVRPERLGYSAQDVVNHLLGGLG